MVLYIKCLTKMTTYVMYMHFGCPSSECCILYIVFLHNKNEYVKSMGVYIRLFIAKSTTLKNLRFLWPHLVKIR